MAIASPRITAECIEANEFPELSQRYQVMAVPKIVINDKVEFEGALPERRLPQRRPPGGRAAAGARRMTWGAALAALLVLAAYVVLVRWVLPRLGVET